MPMVVVLTSTISAAIDDGGTVFIPAGMFGEVQGLSKDGHIEVIWQQAVVREHEESQVQLDFWHPVCDNVLAWVPTCPRCDGHGGLHDDDDPPYTDD